MTPQPSIPESERLTRLEAGLATLSNDVSSLTSSVQKLADAQVVTNSRIDTIGKPRWGALIGTAVAVLMFVCTFVGITSGAFYTLIVVPMQSGIEANRQGISDFHSKTQDAIDRFDITIQREMALNDARLEEATHQLRDFTNLRADQNAAEILRVRDWLWTIAVEDRNALRQLRDWHIFDLSPAQE